MRKYYALGGRADAYERQALVRLRPVLGPKTLVDHILGVRDAFTYGREMFDVQRSLKLRAMQKDRLAEGALDLKFSPGGMVDIEYTVQILQIQCGELGVRKPNTLEALHGPPRNAELFPRTTSVSFGAPIFVCARWWMHCGLAAAMLEIWFSRRRIQARCACWQNDCKPSPMSWYRS